MGHKREREPESDAAVDAIPKLELASASTSSEPMMGAKAGEISSDLLGIKKKQEVNRCSGCRRKVGLIGFRCRCGDVFCWEHRYSDRHDCGFDYKASGRAAIARENPVVRPAKILKV
uniref:AN1-type domain-containing protein n=1 Tax=Kalanchoe fedtschenkoi TaxID=63787 RepID=A0A7N0ZX67_KALFE